MIAVRYFVSDVSRSIEFYVGLGFTLVEQYGPAMAILDLEGMRLWLAGPPASASRPMPDGSQPCPGGWNRFVLQVESVEETFQSLKASGATFRNEPISGPGGSQVLLEDPDGNPIELFEAR